MNRTLSTCMAACALAGMAITAAQAQQIRVRVNGERVMFRDAQPGQRNGRVMIPLRGVLEQLGADVRWLSSEQTVLASKGNTHIRLPIGSHYATVNDKEIYLDAPAMTSQGSTMVPLRFVSEALGADVKWEEATMTASIETDGSARAYRRQDDDRISNRDRDRDRIRDRDRDRNGIPDRQENRQAGRAARLISIPTGTVFPVKLDEQLTSNESRVGDKFTATVVSGIDDASLPEGTKVEGTIVDATPSRDGKPGVLDVDFRRIVLPNEESFAIESSVISLDAKNLERVDGRLTAKGGNQGQERLKWVGIGAGAGLLVSTLTKGNTLVNTILGAGAGYLFNEFQRKGAGNVTLKEGTQIGVKLNKKVAYSTVDR